MEKAILEIGVSFFLNNSITTINTNKGKIINKNLKFNSTDQHAVVQKENKISIDGIEVLPTDLDVEKLYFTSDNL